MRIVDTVMPIILAGGMGTRLREVFPELPKILVPVHGRPFVTYLLDCLIEIGFTQAVISTGYLADMVDKKLGEKYNDLSIKYLRETVPLGTGGAVRKAASRFPEHDLLVMNGDSFFEIELADFISWHIRQRHEASIVLAEVDDVGRFGQVELNKQNLITAFKEKGEESGRGLINAGIYLIKASLLRNILSAGKSSIEYDFFPVLTEKKLYGFPWQGRFIDIGTPESYKKASAFFRS